MRPPPGPKELPPRPAKRSVDDVVSAWGKKSKAYLQTSDKTDKAALAVFARYDVRASGTVSRSDFKLALRDLGVDAPMDQCEKALADVGLDEGDDVDLKSFVRAASTFKGSLRDEEAGEQTLGEAFLELAVRPHPPTPTTLQKQKPTIQSLDTSPPTNNRQQPSDRAHLSTAICIGTKPYTKCDPEPPHSLSLFQSLTLRKGATTASRAVREAAAKQLDKGDSKGWASELAKALQGKKDKKE